MQEWRGFRSSRAAAGLIAAEGRIGGVGWRWEMKRKQMVDILLLYPDDAFQWHADLHSTC